MNPSMITTHVRYCSKQKKKQCSDIRAVTPSMTHFISSHTLTFQRHTHGRAHREHNTRPVEHVLWNRKSRNKASWTNRWLHLMRRWVRRSSIDEDVFFEQQAVGSHRFVRVPAVPRFATPIREHAKHRKRWEHDLRFRGLVSNMSSRRHHNLHQAAGERETLPDPFATNVRLCDLVDIKGSRYWAFHK